MDKVYFESVYGKKIFCILSEPAEQTKTIVIMNHGFRGNSVGGSRTFVNFSKLLTSHAISVLRFDQPNSGNSEGDFIDSSFNEWVDTITYFAKQYLDKGYRVILLGHSMGATASLVATSKAEIKGKIPKLLLWAPDPKSVTQEWFVDETKKRDSQQSIFEENGQQYRASFWNEVKAADFFSCLRSYSGNIHLVYGENDKYVSEQLRNKVMNEVSNKKQEIMILKGQDHMYWEFSSCEQVFKEELAFIKK